MCAKSAQAPFTVCFGKEIRSELQGEEITPLRVKKCFILSRLYLKTLQFCFDFFSRREKAGSLTTCRDIVTSGKLYYSDFTWTET